MVLKSCFAVALVCGVKAAPQFNGDSSLARILQEQRFNMGDGKFGAAYAQEDGVAFKEESTGNNERIGQYSYIDENGKTITVKYSAGINGFRILEGDHIPSGGQNSALAATNAAGEPEEYDYEYYDHRQPQSVFVNPPDPSHHTKHLLGGDLAGHLAGRVFTTPRPGLAQPVEPRRKSFPPGQIQLDRFPEGFNFNFRSQQG
jgi:hypothetical protein